MYWKFPYLIWCHEDSVMSDEQEMQFADPAWQPQPTQPFDTSRIDATLQSDQRPEEDSTAFLNNAQPSGKVEHTYDQGYQAQYTSIPGTQDAKPSQSQQRPQRQQAPLPPPQNQQQQSSFHSAQSQSRQVPPRIWWLIAIIVAISVFGQADNFFGGIFFLLVSIALIAVIWKFIKGRWRLNITGERLPAETRTFAVDEMPTIQVNSLAGSIRLHNGQEKQVTITATKRGYLFRGPSSDTDAEISYTQDRLKNAITARVSSWRPTGKHIIDFDITVPARSSLELSTNAGKLIVQGIEGQIQLKTDAGTIEVSQTILQGWSLLKTNAGSITFSGTVAATGDYEMSTDLGSVKASLATTSSFFLDAHTDLGSVSTNLPLIQPQKNRLLGQIGRGPAYPRLRLKTNLGSVDLSHR